MGYADCVVSKRWSSTLAVAVFLLPALLLTLHAEDSDDDDDDGGTHRSRAGAVFLMSNAASGNDLIIFDRDSKGALSNRRDVSTGGFGSGGGLGNQGALVFGRGTRNIYVVNAGSDEISVFDNNGGDPVLIQQIGSGGRRPVSLTVHDDLLYVLNAGGRVGSTDIVTGFEVDDDGMLSQLEDSTRKLSAADTDPAQVGFSRDGESLIVTEKATGLIHNFAVRNNGRLTLRESLESTTPTPFGFAFDRANRLILSQAAGGIPDGSAVSSYEFDDEGELNVITDSAGTTESAACWIAITRNGRFAYTTNTGSGSVSGYRIHRRSGELEILDDDGLTAVTGTGSSPLDADVVRNRFLYVLSRGIGEVSAFEIGRDGALTALPGPTGLPPSANGLISQ